MREMVQGLPCEVKHFFAVFSENSALLSEWIVEGFPEMLAYNALMKKGKKPIQPKAKGKFETNVPPDLTEWMRDYRAGHGNCPVQEVAEAMIRLYRASPAWLQSLARSGSEGETLIAEAFAALDISLRLSLRTDAERKASTLITVARVDESTQPGMKGDTV
jgi:hypothetical protein